MTNGSESGLLRELRQLADAAAAGPWYVGNADDEAYMSAEFVSTEKIDNAWPSEKSVVAITCLQLPRYAGNDLSEENARFIAAARTAVPRLCDALERALDQRMALARSLRELLVTAEMPGGAIEYGEAMERAQRLLDELDELDEG